MYLRETLLKKASVVTDTLTEHSVTRYRFKLRRILLNAPQTPAIKEGSGIKGFILDFRTTERAPSGRVTHRVLYTSANRKSFLARTSP